MVSVETTIKKYQNDGKLFDVEETNPEHGNERFPRKTSDLMWFEIEMYEDFIDGMVNLLETVENKENVTIDLCLNTLEHFEKIDMIKLKRRYIK